MTGQVEGIDVDDVSAWFAERERRPAAVGHRLHRRRPLQPDLRGDRAARRRRRPRAQVGAAPPPLGQRAGHAPTTWGASTASSPRSRRPGVPVPRRSRPERRRAVNGAPFYVMDFVEGRVDPRRPPTAEALDRDARRRCRRVDGRRAGGDPRGRRRRASAWATSAARRATSPASSSAGTASSPRARQS